MGLFSGSSIILYKNVPGKKSYYSRKCMGTKDVYNHALTTLKTPMAIFKIQMHREKGIFYEKVFDLTSFSQGLGLFCLVFFFGTFYPVILFSETVLVAALLF